MSYKIAERYQIQLAEMLWHIECQHQLGLLTELEYLEQLITARREQTSNQIINPAIK